jgi:hypothetical protein
MPCYIFTYHGKATWMPDHPRGYVHRTHGLQKTDTHMAAHYRFQQQQPAVHFTLDMQELIITAARNASRLIDATVHGVALAGTHAHIVISWAATNNRNWKSIRASVRQALSRALNAQFTKREWFSDSPSRKRIRNYAHFDYLILKYLPDHGTCWIRAEDQTAAQARDAQRVISVIERGKHKSKRKSKRKHESE